MRLVDLSAAPWVVVVFGVVVGIVGVCGLVVLVEGYGVEVDLFVVPVAAMLYELVGVASDVVVKCCIVVIDESVSAGG